MIKVFGLEGPEPAAILLGLKGGKDFAEAEVETVCSGGGITDRDPGTSGGGWAIEHLDPVSIADWGKILMDQGLTGSGGASDGVVVIIADADDPGVIAGGDQGGGGSTGGGVARADGADGARAVGAGQVDALKTGDGDRRGDTLGKSGRDGDVSKSRSGQSSPDFGSAAMSVGANDPDP